MGIKGVGAGVWVWGGRCGVLGGLGVGGWWGWWLLKILLDPRQLGRFESEHSVCLRFGV